MMCLLSTVKEIIISLRLMIVLSLRQEVQQVRLPLHQKFGVYAAPGLREKHLRVAG